MKPLGIEYRLRLLRHKAWAFLLVLASASVQVGWRADPQISSVEKDPALYALEDREGRVRDDFRIPDGLRNGVEFWFDVYTRYTSLDVVIYDRKHPEVVYEVLDFRPLKQSARNAVVFEILAERKVKKRIREYRAAFARLTRLRPPLRPSGLEERILNALARTSHQHSIREHARNLRTQTGQKDHVARGLEAGSAYFPLMEQIFEARGVPGELIALSLVESSFNLRAQSRAGATGVWQFMERSGREYMHVERRRGYDERLSPLKATVAAARLLERNERMFGSWPFAITAYNHGYRGLRRLMKRPEEQRVPEQAFALCQKGSPLGYASKNYYPEFLAMLHAERYRELFFGELRPAPRTAVKFRRLSRSARADRFAREQGLSFAEFRSMNPDVLHPWARLPRGYRVALPDAEGRDELEGLVGKSL